MTAIHPFFASMIAERYNDAMVPDPIYMEKVWFIAERNSDVVLMCDILKSKNITPIILERAKLRKEEAIRIIYLRHPETDAATIKSLLETERRSEVFAGLVCEGKNNKVLADILVEKILEKPTKILAREMVAVRFPDPRAQVAALKVLSGDRRLPDKVLSSKNVLIKNLLAQTEYASALIDNMTAAELVNHDYTTLSSAELHKLVVKLVSAASKKDGEAAYYGHYFLRYVLEALIQIAGNPITGEDTFKLLSTLELSEWFLRAQASTDHSSYCSRFQTVMGASTMSIMVGAVDDVYSNAKSATGNELDKMMSLAIAADKSSSLVEGLLENPQALEHTLVVPLVKLATPLNLAVAMERSRSTPLFKLMWRERGLGTPTKCWEFVADVDDVVVELSKEVYARVLDVPIYQMTRDIEALFPFTVPDQAVLEMPWSVMAGNSSRYSSVLSGPVRRKIIELQLKTLGDSHNNWENFNSFALVWTGTYGALLEASATI